MQTRLSIVIMAGALLGACASPEPVYPEQVSIGQVTNVRDITIQGGQPSSGLGAFAGAIIGGIAGSQIGGGYGSMAATAGGTIAGSVAGHHAEQSGSTSATELSVRFVNGEVRTYRIARPDEHFRIGDTVRIITSGGATRITHRE